MNERELYEKQYGEKKLISTNSFPFLRRILKKYDQHGAAGYENILWHLLYQIWYHSYIEDKKV